MRGDDGVFVFSVAHGGVCQACVLLFLNFMKGFEFKKFTRAFPPMTPPHPKLKFGEVVEVIMFSTT